ncbi:ABC transporter ATP-binding protein [Ferrimonas aestuarii]|uniref:ABC transporter ATP-binding protein n=1 Tax=Ferrimonas aestuarii TaxID=2569539 RepID=A0A4U1BSE8_9GAMM|nr:ABC transporter ATP-binding protein [Ferrimonas aestuarii]TKB57536.1 ABC transporter ATP-binding protein [Ferrimonas aestuarii]
MQASQIGSKPQAIELSQLTFAYPGRNTNLVLDIPKWTLNAGERCFLFGASGAGKSTLLNLISGVLPTTSGKLKVLGQELTQMSSRKRDQFRARHIGVVFQQFNLIPYLSVNDNIQLALHFADDNADDHQDTIVSRIERLFDALQLDIALLQRQSRELSVGQQQRVAIARALINNPELLIVDEPTSALDTYARDNFMTLLMDSCAINQSSLLFVSHDLTLQSYFDLHTDLCKLNRVSGAQS